MGGLLGDCIKACVGKKRSNRLASFFDKAEEKKRVMDAIGFQTNSVQFFFFRK